MERSKLERPKSLSVVVAIIILASAASATPVHLRCEYLKNPLGINKAAPHLSWQSDSGERNWKQAAYEILVASSADRLRTGKADVWDSGKVDSAESVGISYGGPAPGIAAELPLESSCMGCGGSSIGVDGRSMVGDGLSPSD